MRQIASKALRTARISSTHRIVPRSARSPFHSFGHVLGSNRSSNLHPHQRPLTILHSSMQLRRVSAALASSLIAYGAWYSYKATGGGFAGVPDGASSLVPSNSGEESEFTRKAVIISSDSLYTGEIPYEGPISKETDDSGRRMLEMLTPEQASQKLRRNEQSYNVARGQGVVRYDVVQIPSNDPIEDDHSERIVEVPYGVANENSDWMFWGVFDGHSGWTTSAKLRQVLINFVARELNSTYEAAAANPSIGTPSLEAVEAAIKTGFTRLDNEIVHDSVDKVMKAGSKLVAAEMLAPALSGSCALLSFYDSRSQLLRVACTGDSRAVLGRKGESGKWSATPLSTDQTGSNPTEERRMRKEHPGEDYVIRNGRVLGGLEPTRAFGDASYKWSREVSERLKSKFFGRTPSQHLRTPPYVTAEPVVTTTKISPENGDFLVMATDGLWEMLTNEEVVGLVGRWIEKQQQTDGGSSWSRLFTSQNKGLPVEQGQSGDMSVDGQKTPIRQQQWGVKGENDRFIVQDKNVATHLVRNALGGKDQEMVCALLTLPSPYSRRYRDDLTVEVIFFGNGPKNGSVAVNKEATATAVNGDIKAKL